MLGGGEPMGHTDTNARKRGLSFRNLLVLGASDRALPIHAVGDERLLGEIRALAEAFLSQAGVRAQEEVA